MCNKFIPPETLFVARGQMSADETQRNATKQERNAHSSFITCRPTSENKTNNKTLQEIEYVQPGASQPHLASNREEVERKNS